MKKILILGGTGAMGKHLVANLSSKGDFQVYVTSRKNHSPEGNAQYLQGDAHNEA